MARALTTDHTRLVVLTTSNDPSELRCEYRVGNDGLEEEPKSEPQASPDFNQSVNALWTGTMTAVNGVEGI